MPTGWAATADNCDVNAMANQQLASEATGQSSFGVAWVVAVQPGTLLKLLIHRFNVVSLHLRCPSNPFKMSWRPCGAVLQMKFSALRARVPEVMPSLLRCEEAAEHELETERRRLQAEQRRILCMLSHPARLSDFRVG